jgi:uncharacterized protein YbjT (DUF2867 family)
VERVRRGKPYLLFGDGALTACKPISDADLGRYLAECIDDKSRWNRILPIGGPGEAITPKQQGEQLFALLGREPRFKHVPIGLMNGIIAVLGALGRVSPALAARRRSWRASAGTTPPRACWCSTPPQAGTMPTRRPPPEPTRWRTTRRG